MEMTQKHIDKATQLFLANELPKRRKFGITWDLFKNPTRKPLSSKRSSKSNIG